MIPRSAAALPAGLDPARVFDGGPAHDPYGFWLDAGPDAASGWSWTGVGRPEPRPERVREVVCGTAAEPRVETATDLPGAFRGGWVGWLGYDAAARRAGAAASVDATDVPATAWVRVDSFVAFDHAAGLAWAVAPADELDAFVRTVATWIDTPGPQAPVGSERTTAVGRDSPAEYAAAIQRCRDAIREGDAYQLCLTTRFHLRHPVDPVAAFRALRAAVAAPHGGIVRVGGTALVSASPEQFLAVRGARVRTRPIKGTRPRGADHVADEESAAELLASPKERAENLMIVDLMRNDLSRVCRPGTVAVEELFAVESYPAVHQLVSTVTGALSDGVTVGELLDASFPAGSMTGAPKLSAMNILHGLERSPRGLFAGCFGWVGDDGCLDLAMVIRSIVTHPTGAYVGAGGGITWGSEPWAEVAEVGIKARGPLQAAGAELPPGW